MDELEVAITLGAVVLGAALGLGGEFLGRRQASRLHQRDMLLDTVGRVLDSWATLEEELVGGSERREFMTVAARSLSQDLRRLSLIPCPSDVEAAALQLKDLSNALAATQPGGDIPKQTRGEFVRAVRDLRAATRNAM